MHALQNRPNLLGPGVDGMGREDAREIGSRLVTHALLSQIMLVLD